MLSGSSEFKPPVVSAPVVGPASPLVSPPASLVSVVSGGVTSLLVTGVPPALNNISTLNQYFSKFGVIVNVQVCLRLTTRGLLAPKFVRL